MRTFRFLFHFCSQTIYIYSIIANFLSYRIFLFRRKKKTAWYEHLTLYRIPAGLFMHYRGLIHWNKKCMWWQSFSSLLPITFSLPFIRINKTHAIWYYERKKAMRPRSTNIAIIGHSWYFETINLYSYINIDIFRLNGRDTIVIVRPGVWAGTLGVECSMSPKL